MGIGQAAFRAAFEQGRSARPLSKPRLSCRVHASHARDVVGLVWNGDDAALERLKKWLHRADLAWAPGTAVTLASYDNFHGTDAPT